MITLLFPYLTPSQNQTDRWHWRKLAKHKKDLYADTAAIAKSSGVIGTWHPTPMGKRRRPGEEPSCEPIPKKVSLKITRHSTGELDYGNFVGVCKALVDAIVAWGFVFDDSPEFMEATYHQALAPRGQGYVTVEIEES